MPERFGFSCLLLTPVIPLPVDAINAAAAALPGRIGLPVEVMLLDLGSNQRVVKSWQSAKELLLVHPSPMETLFVYYSGAGGESGRICISLQEAKTAWTMTVSLADMAIASETQEIANVCLRLHRLGATLAGECVVVAGGEIGLDPELGSTKRAIAASLDRQSLAAWVASDASLIGWHDGFEVACLSEGTIILKRK